MYDGVGVQLEESVQAPVMAIQLDLFDDVVTLPWYGKSSRSLTRGAEAVFSRREPQQLERFFVDPDQYDLFRRRRKKAPGVSSPGAPLLVPLNQEVV